MPGPPAGGRPWIRRLRLFAATLPIVVILLAVAYFFLALHFSFSNGDRAGYVQKLSRRGWVCKSWEGELAMVNLPGTAPEIFPFTVRDDAVATEINKYLGDRVVLSYEQHPGLPRCFGETEYFVTRVRRAQ